MWTHTRAILKEGEITMRKRKRRTTTAALVVVSPSKAKAILKRIQRGETTVTAEAEALGLESYGVLKQTLVKVCGIGAYQDALADGREARQYPRRRGGRKEKEADGDYTKS